MKRLTEIFLVGATIILSAAAQAQTSAKTGAKRIAKLLFRRTRRMLKPQAEHRPPRPRRRNPTKPMLDFRPVRSLMPR